jgi:hypothetical protein
MSGWRYGPVCLYLCSKTGEGRRGEERRGEERGGEGRRGDGRRVSTVTDKSLALAYRTEGLG